MQSDIRNRIEEAERTILSPRAVCSSDTLGRDKPEEPDALRTEFQRDRDRIVHCKAFRRLKHKTQVFLAPRGDHYRTRLTHTLEVSQIARTISRALQLNEDLTEAIALGHDLGHTPFGHAGERALSARIEGGFRHYEQSVRVVEKLEKNGRGLNLTKEVRDGILCHTRGKEAMTLEGRVVRLADRIAYINHDIEDAEHAGVLRQDQIPVRLRRLFGERLSERVNIMVNSAVTASLQSDTICLQPEIAEAVEELHEFMFANVYTNPEAKGEEDKAVTMIHMLYDYFLQHPEELQKDVGFVVQSEGLERAAADFTAGMTDDYAVHSFSQRFVPNSWSRD